LLSDSYDNILSDIAEFLRLHPEEIVSMDFNHLYGFNTADLHNEFLNHTFSILGGSIGAGAFNRTFADLLDEPSHAIVFYANPTVAAAWNISPSADLPTPWANKQDMSALVSALVVELSARTDFDHGMVTQLLMTPDLNMLASGIITGQNSALEVANRHYTDLEDIIKTDFDADKVNIINTDYYTKNFIKSIVSLN